MTETQSEGIFNMANATYDRLKATALIILPALGTLYFAVAQIWGLPYAEQVVGTITALVTFLGVSLHISSSSYNKQNPDYDGVMIVNETDPMKDSYLLELSAPLDDIKNRKSITFEVQNEGPSQ